MSCSTTRPSLLIEKGWTLSVEAVFSGARSWFLLGALTWAIDALAQTSCKVEAAKVTAMSMGMPRQRWVRSSRGVLDAIRLSRSIEANKLS